MAILSKCPPSAVLFYMDSSQKLIRSSEIPREPPRHLNAIQPTFHKISHPQAFRAAIFFEISSVSHLAFDIFSPKVNQINRNNQRTTTSNLNAIQTTVHMISRPQAFRADIFSKCPPSVILFFINSSQKLIRSPEIPREPPIKFKWNPFKG